MDEKDKLSGIENYFKELFSGCVIENTWDSKSRKYVFHVDAPTGETKHTISISSEFVSDNEPEDIVTCLKLDNLKGYLEIFGNKEVLVTNDGTNPDGIRPSVMKQLVISELIYQCFTLEKKMGKSRDTKKDVKKKPTKTIKEKRKEKQEKKKHQ